MKKICLIAGSIVTIGFMSACTNETETKASHSVSSEAEKNALEAEQAELELAKLAELQRQSEPQVAKSGGRKPASTEPAKVVKADKPEKKKKVEAAKPETKVGALKALEANAAQAAKAEKKAAAKKAVVAESPQAMAKKEIAAEASVLKPAAAAPAVVPAVAHEAPKAEAKVEPAVVHAAQPAPQPASEPKAVTTVAANVTAPAAKISKPAKAAASVYIVQVGAFRIKDNALKLEEKLKGSGFPVRMKEVNHSKNGLLYVVQFEPTPNRDEADAWRSQVKAKASLESQLVSRPD